MAQVLTAALQVVGNVIQNQPVTCVVTVSNSGAASVNVTSVVPKLTPNNGPYKATAVAVPPSQAVAATSGSQQQVAVGAGASVVFTFQVVPLGATVATGQPQQGSRAALVEAVVTSDDGFTCTSVPQWLAPAGPQFGQPPGSPPNASPGAYGGMLQFNRGTNSAMAL